MNHFDAILIDGKLTQLWHAFVVFLKDKNWHSFSNLSLISFCFVKNEKRLDVSFRYNFL